MSAAELWMKIGPSRVYTIQIGALLRQITRDYHRFVRARSKLEPKVVRASNWLELYCDFQQFARNCAAFKPAIRFSHRGVTEAMVSCAQFAQFADRLLQEPQTSRRRAQRKFARHGHGAAP